MRKAMRRTATGTRVIDDRPGVLEAMAFVLRGAHRVQQLRLDFGQLAPSTWQRLDRILGACSALQQLHILNWPAMGELSSLGRAEVADACSADPWAPQHPKLGTVAFDSCTVGKGLLGAAASLLQHAHTVRLHLMQESKATMGIMWRSRQEPSGVLLLLRAARGLRHLTLQACKALCPSNCSYPLLETLSLLRQGHPLLQSLHLEHMHFAGGVHFAMPPPAPKATGLLSLNLHSIPLHRDDLGAVVQACAQLQRLHLDKCRLQGEVPTAAGHDSLLQLVQSSTPHLTQFTMNWCTNTTWRDLSVPSSSAGDQLRVRMLAEGGVTALALGGFQCFAQDTVRSLAQAFPHTRTLDVSHAKGVTADTVLQCLLAFPDLEALDVCHTALTLEQVQQLRGRVLMPAPPEGAAQIQTSLAVAAPHVFVLA